MRQLVPMRRSISSRAQQRSPSPPAAADALLLTSAQKKQLQVEKQQIEAVMNAEGEAAGELLQTIHGFIHSPGYE